MPLLELNLGLFFFLQWSGEKNLFKDVSLESEEYIVTLGFVFTSDLLKYIL